jgi:8-oxo-dGTP diphosphatase
MRGAWRTGAFAVADAGGARALPVVRPIGRAGSEAATVDVAVSIVRSNDGRVLLAERTANQIAAGFWELPGGKIDRGETPAEAAARELAEEVGIIARGLRPWVVYDHAFRRKRVRLHFFRVDQWTGTPHGREGQRLAWVDPALPHVRPVLPSNDRALTALGLSDHYLITPGGDAGLARIFLASLPEALTHGVRIVAVREPHLTADQRVALARRIVELARPFNAHVVLAGSVLQARRAGATGLYSTAADLRRFSARPPVRLWAVSCGGAADADRAVALGADVVVLAPVLPGAGDPDHQPLSWGSMERLASAIRIPVYAQAGTASPPASLAQRAGAIGILAHRINVSVTLGSFS